MSTPPPRPPRSRSAFAAAFLSLLFPGLGHAYAGAYARALGFAAAPLLLIALGGGILLRADKGELLGFVANQTVLIAVFVANILLLAYRIVAAVDAWQVARFLNAGDASGGGRLGRARLPVHPVSIVGLVAVIAVMAAGHLAVARYNVLAMDLVGCVFSADGEDASCDSPPDAAATDESTAPDESFAPGDSSGSGELPLPSDEAPTPDASAHGTVAATLPPWDGKDRLNILLVGVDTRDSKLTSYNTDTLIVVSVDPVTKQVAMFQAPRDMADLPVPDNARAAFGSTYGRKINSWYNFNRNRTDLWPGKKAETRGFNALKALLGKLYGLDIRYWVKVDFAGFRKVVDTVGGVNVNVQIPVYESEYPAGGGALKRVYIPVGPQQMTGSQALVYARSRHGAGSDFDRGRRQQRVLLSLREQMSAQAVIANLPSLVQVLGSAVKTDIPVAELPKLLALADSVDTKNVRSYVFGRSYGTESMGTSRGYFISANVPRIRRAVKEAFSITPEVLARRDRLGAEAARVWVANASGNSDLATSTGEYLSYFGLDASAPNKKLPKAPTSTIVVYNGAEAQMAETVKYLEEVFGVSATAATDPSVTVDMIVTLGQDAPRLKIDALG